MSRLSELPEQPLRPHRFYELQRRTVALPGRSLRLSYVEAGRGPPLLLVHGLMTNAYSFRYVIPALAEHYHVLVPDLPGAGRSDSPADLSMHPRELAQVLGAFLSAVGVERAYVVGNSLGGYLALWLWLVHPERVERLVVMHAPGFGELRLQAMKAALSLPGANALLRLLTRDADGFVAKNVHYADPKMLSREEVREYAAIFRDPARARMFGRVLKETMDPSAMVDLRRALKAKRPSNVPVLLQWSTKDALISPEYGPRYQQVITGAELEWFDGASHFLQVDAPEKTVASLLRFGVRTAGGSGAPSAG